MFGSKETGGVPRGIGSLVSRIREERLRSPLNGFSPRFLIAYFAVPTLFAKLAIPCSSCGKGSTSTST